MCRHIILSGIIVMRTMNVLVNKEENFNDQDFCRVSSAVAHGLEEKWNEQQYSIT